MAERDTFPYSHHIVWIYPSSLSGLLHIAPRLEMVRELRNIGWQVTFLAAGEAGNHTINGVTFTCIPRPDIYLLRQVLFHSRALHYLSKSWGEIDFILFHQTSLPMILLALAIRNIKGQKKPLFVMDSRTVPMEGQNAKLKDALRGQFSNLMNRLANRFVDGQTAITCRMASELRIPEKQLWGTWPSGVNIQVFQSAIAQRRWPQGEEPVKIVYTGMLSIERNLIVLCQSVTKANQEGMNFELYLIGAGNDYDRLAKYANHSGGKICVFPPVPHSEVPEILARMHIGALPFADEQKFRVSSPIKLFEYMGSGMPILATRIVCHTDIIGERPCTFWAEDSSVEGFVAALCNVWAGRQALQSMGEISAEIAKEYTWAVSAKKLSTALKDGLATWQKNGPS